MKIALAVLSTLLTGLAFADVCTPTPATPACPTTGVGILDDTYPVQALVISQLPMARTEQARALPRRTMLETMRAFNFDLERVPYLIYPARSGDLTTIREELLRDLVAAGVPRERASALVTQRLRSVDVDPYTWQQDYFESSFDPRTGAPRIRYSEVYEGHWEGSRQSAEAIGRAPVCQVAPGDDLRSFAGKNAGGGTNPTRPEAEYGGNIEGLPGGLCLVGNNQREGFSTQICGPAANIVRAEVDWLEVGHVDEIFKVVPRVANDGRPRECAFSILAADTDLGLSLLGESDTASTPVLDRQLDPAITGLPGATAGFSATNRVNNPVRNSPAYQILCGILDGRSGGQDAPATPGQRVDQVFLRLFMDSAYAQQGPARDERTSRSRRGRTAPTEVTIEGKPAAPVAASEEDQRLFRCLQNSGSVTHRDFAAALRESEVYAPLRVYNQKIQESLNRSKQAMYTAILAKLPQCRSFFPNVDSMFTKVPNYFSPPSPTDIDAHMTNGELDQPGAEAMSLFPNPTNGVLVNRSLLLPGPVPRAYQDSLGRSLGALGLTGVPMDTWDYAHAGSGNLHCASHTLPYCRPGGQR